MKKRTWFAQRNEERVDASVNKVRNGGVTLMACWLGNETTHINQVNVLLVWYKKIKIESKLRNSRNWLQYWISFAADVHHPWWWFSRHSHTMINHKLATDKFRVYGELLCSQFTCVGRAIWELSVHLRNAQTTANLSDDETSSKWNISECSSVEHAYLKWKQKFMELIAFRICVCSCVRLSSDHTSQPYHWHEWIKMDGVPYLMPTDMAHNSTIGRCRCRWDAIWNINVMNELRSCSFLMSNSLPTIWNIHICTHTHTHLPHPKTHSACD